MQYIPFGNTGMTVSRFCLGTMGFGAQIDKERSFSVMAEAMEHGVNFFDTAESYGDSEQIVGEFLEGKRDKVFIGTKVFKSRVADGRCGNNSRVNIMHSVERSLKLLRTDYIDLYMLHQGDDQTPVEETLSTLDQLVRAGKIRHWGVTNHYAWQMAYMIGVSNRHSWEPMISFQTCYNIIDRPFELETSAFCEKFNLGTMIYSPLGGGFLAGKYQRGVAPPEGSRVVKWGAKMLAFHENENVHDILDELKVIAQEQGVQINQLAIMWLLARPYVSTVILGGSKPEHYTPMYEIADRLLDDEIVQRIDEISTCQIYKGYRNKRSASAPGLAAQW